MSSNGTITIVVRDLTTGNSIPEFKFIINLNNVGDPQVEKPVNDRDPSLFPSLRPPDSHSPVVAVGEDNGSSTVEVTLPVGKYLVSILAPGYKMGGNWVTVTADGISAVEVNLQPNPLPLSKIRVHVFHDNRPVNGEDDFPLENGLDGFLIIMEDAIGEVTVDYFGNPLGTEYERDQLGNIIFDSDGNPIPVPNTGGRILTDANGDAIIDNLPPGKYGVQAIPPDGTDWIQTTTIEGTHVIDAWIEEGNDGYGVEEGFHMPLVWFGFVRPLEFPVSAPREGGMITGRIRAIIEFTPPLIPLVLGDPVDRPWIGLTDIGANDQQVYTGRGDINGNFVIQNVPPGTYQMAIWDEPLDYIISFRTVIVSQGQTINMGDIGIPRWFGYIKGSVFHDENSNGFRDAGEMGIPDVEVNTRFKDGSIQYNTITDMNGNYILKEVFELERFCVAEIGFTRFALTGATATPSVGAPMPSPTGCVDLNGNSVRCPETFPDVLTLAVITWAATTNQIDWGKRPYNRGENGGITGIVYYATMRNEINPRFEVAEDYEPGIPNVTLNLYATTELNGQIVQGSLLNVTQADAWQHPEGCIDANGQSIPCVEIPSLENQIRPSVFDGGYAFETYFDPYYGAPNALEKPLQEGNYIVEVVTPTGYKVIDEFGSVNTDQGDQFTPQNANTNSMVTTTIHEEIDMRVAQPPYYEPPETPGQLDMHKKVVKMVDQRNSAADFYLYTDVPVPGRIIGLLVDDLNLEFDPNSILFGEKRGIPDTPIGIRDFTGRLITTVHSDVNGYFEVLLPSTYTRNVPTPSGLAPGMYRVIGNDPGDPDSPNERYNPDYQTLNLVFDVWPGTTTYADVAILPITAFVQGLGNQFLPPPVCELPDNTPQIFRVSKVEVDVSDLNISNRTFTILGLGFGTLTGVVTLNNLPIDILNWDNEEITASVPINFSLAGPSQLMITTPSGKISSEGLTFHLRKPNVYWPSIIHVKKDGTGDYLTIQEAIDAASDETIIVVNSGTYYENPILYKNIKLQGVGQGGIYANGDIVQGSVLDGRFFTFNQNQWLAKLNSIDFDGAESTPPDQVKDISKGQVITVVAKSGAFISNFKPQIDGFTIQGGRGTEGGGIYVNAHCQYLVISNNTIQGNGGGFGGSITIGKAYRGDNFNDYIHVHHNSIMKNGGISLAGAIGIFNGADHYNIEYNRICGNYSAEYGGGISHFGMSKDGQIHHNKLEFNASFDEGGGILVGGEEPIPPQMLTAGSGEVEIYNNLIQGNLANDDGGGVRLLKPLDYRITIYNNMIVNNVSTDIGGGIALDDASNVVIVNNTIAKNITTATAEDSDGRAHGAGLVSENHSAPFQATLPPNAPKFSDPILFNNIFWDNRAGVFDQSLNGGTGGIIGIGNYGEPPNVIDLEVFGTPNLEYLHPQYCSLTAPYPNGSNNIVGDPKFITEYNLTLSVLALNMEPDFKVVKIVMSTSQNMGDYHITHLSPVIGQGTSQVTNGTEIIVAPNTDFDGNPRPSSTGYDIGADQYVAP
jgi:hypothetical protein